MSKELTIKIMRDHLGISNPTTAQVIEFVVKSSLSAEQKKDIEQLAESLNLDPNTVFLKATDLEKYLEEKEIDIKADFSDLAMYLKALPDELDRNKSAKGFEITMKLVPVEYLNKLDLPNLIGKCLSQEFWEPRVRAMTNKTNKQYFFDRTGIAVSSLPEYGSSFVTYQEAKEEYDVASTDDEKILALKHMISQMGGNNTDYLRGLSNFTVQEQLKSLEEMYGFLKFTSGY